jgi:class 3 adenylate cyclase
MSETRKLAAILVADIVGYSRLAGADEDRILARLRTLRSDLIDPTIAVHHGRVVKRTGDGSIIEFRSVVDAARCAIEMQNGLVERNAGVPPERRIEFRVGIHVGDVVEESDGDLMGDGVNIAARLEGIAKPGTICLSEDAYRQVKGRLEMKVSALGATHLKNIAEPVRAYLVEVARLKRWSAPRHRLVAALGALLILVVAGAAGWRFIAGKPSATAGSSTTLTASSFGPTVSIIPAAGDQPMAPSHTQTQRQAKPALTSQPDPEPTARNAVHSSAKRQTSSSEPQSPSVESASDSSRPCFISAAQTNGNHPSCAYLRGLPSSLESAQSPFVESASNSSQPCFNSAAQTNGNHPSCAYLRGY